MGEVKFVYRFISCRDDSALFVRWAGLRMVVTSQAHARWLFSVDLHVILTELSPVCHGFRFVFYVFFV